MKTLTLLTGAGMSAESGIATFRDANGLWEGHDVMEVATPDGFRRNPDLVLEFYNQRRRQLHTVKPNVGHTTLAQMEKEFKINIVTQNVDNLHEAAGSSNVLHLHGELLKVRSTKDPNYIIEWPGDLHLGDCDPNGRQLRPHIVWFGEEVPVLEEAVVRVQEADAVVVIGTSMQVYPAAGLIHFARPGVPLFYIDPKPATLYDIANPLEIIPESASIGVPLLWEKLKKVWG
ncbi:SIR2 family NAD-dependent protein deacylase [Flavobacterium stagni]|uniref:NAD-dependent protein deacylase n=1 Tax=Flavobacterium stagni TaxID=2506421 RepID=A0A4Q1KDB2_9FLAO|nr:NAD-dependent deacylase [Flavobacterium stagni]RXR23362.1 NAD-dependent deacylase [Flavobacterium stagni]